MRQLLIKVALWSIFIQQKLSFGLVLSWLAVVKKKLKAVLHVFMKKKIIYLMHRIKARKTKTETSNFGSAQAHSAPPLTTALSCNSNILSVVPKKGKSFGQKNLSWLSTKLNNVKGCDFSPLPSSPFALQGMKKSFFSCWKEWLLPSCSIKGRRVSQLYRQLVCRTTLLLSKTKL